jgi:HEAT repeat protein
MNAVRVLCDFGDKAVPALLRALDSSDEQQRPLAAFVLRWLDSKPSRRLCELSVEALGDPEIEGYYRTLIHRPALSATRWLDAHAQSKEVVPHLLAAARSEHAQRRFLAAALLARAGVQRDLPHTCSVLLAQLPDNSRLGDALVAAHALYKLGAATLPQIKLAYRGADDQARSLLQLVEESLADDAAGITRTEAELLERYHRLGLSKVTDARIDPARGHPFLGLAVLPRL